MKIRTITTGISLTSTKEAAKIGLAGALNRQAQSWFESLGYVVQSTRVTTNPWGEYLAGLSPTEIVAKISALDLLAQELGVDFLNIGCAKTPEEIAIIPEINSQTSASIYTSSQIGDGQAGINWANARESARAIDRISRETENGYGNFRFCASANCPPGIPFFPASYHEGEISFAIGLECSDSVSQAFAVADSLPEAGEKLMEILSEALQKIEAIALELSQQSGFSYRGIDASVAPSLDPDESIAFAYESLGFGKFGQPATLAISAAITEVLKNLPVKTCGYSGLMLPVCEDAGLAQRANEQTYNLSNLLLYSAVCGCGLDTVPIPGDVTVSQIEAILLDVASLAIKLDKPLSARLLPVPGKKAGEMTNFNSPYLVDCKIMKV
ncbi:MAG: DUF711 family protein [Oscillatoria sp. SIO1A7]|nr:DUF711 family protein [Oscillatoria sp. SIO1A7]